MQVGSGFLHWDKDLGPLKSGFKEESLKKSFERSAYTVGITVR